MSNTVTSLDRFLEEAALEALPRRRVYRATDQECGRKVVVKILETCEDKERNREDAFLRVLGAVQFLHLAAFPDIRDFGITNDGEAFIIMEPIDGERLEEFSDPDPRRVLRILSHIAEALEALAMADISHDNLSADNILVIAGPNGDAAKILGLGSAAFFGTPAGDSPSDLEALGRITATALGCEIEVSEEGGTQIHLGDEVHDVLPQPDLLRQALEAALAAAPGGQSLILAELKNAFEMNRVGGVDPETQVLRAEGDWTAETIVETSLPLSDPADEPKPSAENEGDSTSAAPNHDDKTLILGQRDTAGLLTEDLIETGPVTFNPNQTDPIFDPPKATPPPLPARQDAPTAAAVDLAEKTTPGRSLKVLIWSLGALAVLSVSAVGLVAIWRLFLRPPAKVEPPVAVVEIIPAVLETQPEAPVETSFHSGLAEAEGFLADGDVEAARSVLEGIPPADVANFSNEEAENFRALQAALEGSRMDAAVADLEGGLRHGSIRMLKRGVASLESISSDERSERSEAGPLLERAQKVLRLHALMWKAHETGDHALVLERSTAMVEALPNYSTGPDWRTEATAALESLSGQALASGRFEPARELLAPIQKHWPGRPGLGDRLKAIDSAEALLGKQRGLLAAALEEGDPEAGIKMLELIAPSPLLSREHDEALDRLRRRLAEADAGTPEIELAPQTDLSFKKKKPVELKLSIRDDHRVVRVTAFIKTSARRDYATIELGIDPAGDSCTLQIGPEVHRNDDFFLYFEAVDVSGHTGRLGSPESPLEITRKKGLKALFGK